MPPPPSTVLSSCPPPQKNKNMRGPMLIGNHFGCPKHRSVLTTIFPGQRPWCSLGPTGRPHPSGPDGITSFRFLENHDVKPPMYSTNLLWALVNFWNLYRVYGHFDVILDPSPGF